MSDAFCVSLFAATDPHHMSDTFWVQLFGFLALALTAAVNLTVSLLNHRKQTQTASELKVVKENVVTIEKATNSMKDALVKAVGEKEFLAGEASGQAKSDAIKAAVADASHHPAVPPPPIPVIVIPGAEPLPVAVVATKTLE